jgi:Rieske Fe-S protein
LCTHLPCVLEWRASSATLACPCHGAQFNSDGSQRAAPEYPQALRPLAVFPIKQIGGRVYVQLPADADGDNDGDYEGQPSS